MPIKKLFTKLKSKFKTLILPEHPPSSSWPPISTTAPPFPNPAIPATPSFPIPITTAAIPPTTIVPIPITPLPVPTTTMRPPFPAVHSPALLDPPPFFSDDLRQPPLPTNSFWQNLVLKFGDQPEYIHPYLIRSAGGSLSVCYPSRFVSPGFLYQIFIADLTISSSTTPTGGHTISAFDDLSITLDYPGGLSFPLVRGSPFLTAEFSSAAGVSISTIHAILSLTSTPDLSKHVITLNNGQTWLIYSSSPLRFSQTIGSLTAGRFSGVLRIAFLPDPSAEPILDLFRSAYPISGSAVLTKPFSFQYEWRKRGTGDLLLLAHPLHRRLLPPSATVLPAVCYRSIDGDLVGVVGDSWTLLTNAIPITWHSMSGVSECDSVEIAAALAQDVAALDPNRINTTSTYFYGKAIARAARLALIAEELGLPELIPAVRDFLRDSITPWLEGSFRGNGFQYDTKWGGITSQVGSADTNADFGFGVYNDHHYHLGYFVYAMAVLVKLDHGWGRRYRPQIYSITADYMSAAPSASFPKLRNFDPWKLHSWAGGLTEFADGRNQESTSEAVAAYYAGALLGLAYGDPGLVAVGSTVAAMEIQAAQTWWHIPEGGDMYEEEFSKGNRVVGVLWSNKRDSGLWFAPAEWRECRLGIQMLPILPITEVLFSNTDFVKQLVNWVVPVLGRDGVGEGWKGFAYAMEAIYDKKSALQKIRTLNGHDDGNSLTNLLWWAYSRRDGDDYGWKCCWFSHGH
ncbi:ascus wall endo-1,3(4)-beta-glucanase [Nymphaea colorata]|nr:ascus wall endo-1,3(4)-beta-glucanase [Nymphaea colorata]